MARTLAELPKGTRITDYISLGDRYFFSFELWQQARATGSELLWRIRKNLRLPCEQRLDDGSYLSRIYPSQQDRQRQRHGVVLRVIDYRLEGVAGAEPMYRLVTTRLDPEPALFRLRRASYSPKDA
jgi:hypothetical protein